MEFASVWQLSNLGLTVDFGKRTCTIRLGPLNIVGIPFPVLRAMASNTSDIGALLSRLFIQRGVMWEKFDRERFDECVNSLRGMQKDAQTRASEFSKTNRPEDQTITTVLQAWANKCDQAATELEIALREENDPLDSGLDTSAHDSMDCVLAEFRCSTYPFVEFFIELLPHDSPIRIDASDKLKGGKDILVRHLGVSVGGLATPEIEIT